MTSQSSLPAPSALLQTVGDDVDHLLQVRQHGDSLVHESVGKVL